MDKKFIEQSNVMHQYSQLLGTIMTSQNFEIAAQIFSTKLSQFSLNEMNPLVLQSLIDSILGKILMLFKNSELPINTKILILRIKEKKLMSPLFQNVFNYLYPDLQGQYTLCYLEDCSEDLYSVNTPKEYLNCTLEMLFNINNEKHLDSNNCLGYSLVSLDGNFIWCDSKSEQLFEMKGKEIYNQNLFDLMIPYSNNTLFNKFGSELFKDKTNVPIPVSFSYVIYSKKATNKFIKQLKKKDLVNAKEIFNYKLLKDSKAIYHRYLKALSSKASLIMIKYTDKELEEISSRYQSNVNLNELLNKSSIMHKVREIISRDYIKNIKSMKMSEFKQKNEFDLISITNGLQTGTDHYKLVVQLETRIARKIPDFNYNEMIDDEKIKELEALAKSKLKSDVI